MTNVPRSLAAALPPIAAGWMLGITSFGWPLVIGGVLKATYDVLLLLQFRDLRPPEETRSVSPHPCSARLGPDAVTQTRRRRAPDAGPGAEGRR